MKILLKLLFACLLTMSSFNLKAQFSLSIGVAGGVNLSTIVEAYDFVDTDIYEPTGGLILAVPINIGISRMFSVQPEIMFIQKGYKDDYLLSGGFNDQAKILINQIDLPLLARFNFVNSDAVIFYTAVGPVLGFAQNAKYIDKSNGQTTKLDIDLDLTDYNRFEVSASIGIGVGFNVGFGHIIFDTRFLLGISDTNGVIDNNNYYYYNDEYVRNVGLQLRLGYSLPLVKAEYKEEPKDEYFD